MPQVRAILGVLGLILTIPALIVTLSVGTGGPFDLLGSTAADVRDGIGRIAATMDRVDASLRSAEATLKGAQASATDAASVTKSLGTAMANLADAADLRVLGTQPFAPLIPQFTELSKRSAALSTSLATTGTSLGSSRADLAALHDDVAALADLARSLNRAADGSAAAKLIALRVVTSLLLAWLAALAALMLFDARRGVPLPK